MRILITLLLTFALGACLTFYPLGMTEEEWLKLTPEQQFQARIQQAEIDKAAEERRARELAVEEARLAAQEAERQARIDELYRRGRRNDFIQCEITDAVVDFYPGWRAVEDSTFSLAREEGRDLEMRQRDSYRTTSIWVGFKQDGTSVFVCQSEPSSEYDRGDCNEFTGTHQEFRAGFSARIDIPAKIRGGLTCGFGRNRGWQRKSG